MTKSADMTLAAFQHADSFFPSAAVSFSWGLEALSNRGLVATRDDLSKFVNAQLIHRWAGFDRPVLVHAHAAAPELAALAELDFLVEAQTLAREQREGSRRMGAALLSVHAKLATPGAEDFLSDVQRGDACGHLAVAQGLVWRQLGFDAELVQLMAAHGMCTGLLGAAVRLAIIGHVDAQLILREMHRSVENVLAQPVCGPDALNSFVPQTEIASMNHETDDMRLFAN